MQMPTRFLRLDFQAQQVMGQAVGVPVQVAVRAGGIPEGGGGSLGGCRHLFLEHVVRAQPWDCCRCSIPCDEHLVPILRR